jgi:2-hydroxychromene-2-carboxylate isomerase
MESPIRFYFDFASPYAWFALDAAEKLAADHGREVEWRPMLVWAILKAHGIPSPMDIPQRRHYFLADMERSAAYCGVQYRRPIRLPISTHSAARIYYWLAEQDDIRARLFGRDIFTAFFVEQEDVADRETLLRLAERRGLERKDAEEAMDGPLGRARLSAAVDEALKDGVVGSPFFVVDGEGFFGADRLPQIAWRLASKKVSVGIPGGRDNRA